LLYYYYILLFIPALHLQCTVAFLPFVAFNKKVPRNDLTLKLSGEEKGTSLQSPDEHTQYILLFRDSHSLQFPDEPFRCDIPPPPITADGGEGGAAIFEA
jgi:hypothetical protein